MKNFLFVPVLLASAMLASQAQSAGETSFRVDKIGAGSACRIVAVNRTVAPVTVAVKVTAGVHQHRPGQVRSLRAVIEPNSTREITRIQTKDHREPCRGEMTYTHSVGDAFAAPDLRHRYRLPFRKGTIVRVAQEPGGVLTTHKDDLSRYAFDLAVPEGTPVLAARAGSVIEIRDTFSEGRRDPKLAEKTNFVSIIHTDGTFAQYAHLTPHSILVRPGEWVEAGQMIGKSGNTGFAGGPHLHFDLRRARIGADGTVKQESLPLSFFSQRSGKKITLTQRKRITVD